jgi:hypothetical protein
MSARKYAGKSRGRPFQPGNPGKPQGARHRTTLAVESLLDGEAEKLTRKAIELALAGDATALRLCLERIAPLRRGRPVMFQLPSIDSAADVVTAIGEVTMSLASGLLTPEEAITVANVIEIKRKAIETLELEARMRAIEQRINFNEESN